MSEKRVRCINLQKEKTHYYPESATKKEWFKRGGWVVEDLSTNQKPEPRDEDSHADTGTAADDFSDTGLKIAHAPELTAKENIKLLRLCETIEEVETFKKDERVSVQEAVEKRLRELNN